MEVRVLRWHPSPMPSHRDLVVPSPAFDSVPCSLRPARNHKFHSAKTPVLHFADPQVLYCTVLPLAPHNYDPPSLHDPLVSDRCPHFASSGTTCALDNLCAAQRCRDGCAWQVSHPPKVRWWRRTTRSRPPDGTLERSMLDGLDHCRMKVDSQSFLHREGIGRHSARTLVVVFTTTRAGF